MTKRSFQSLLEIVATCVTCDLRCDARNAQVWAHQHARKTGHIVYVSPTFRVESAQRFMFEDALPPRGAE